LTLYDPERKPSSINILDKELQANLRKYNYDFKKAEKICNEIKSKVKTGDNFVADSSVFLITFNLDGKDEEQTGQNVGPVSEEDLIALKKEEKPQVTQIYQN